MNDQIREFARRISSGVQKKKSLVWIFLLAGCGIVLILASRIPAEEAPASDPAVSSVSQSAVEEALEERLRGLVEAITGNDEASVLVTLEGDSQTVYATQGKTNIDKQSGGTETSRSQTDSESSYVIVKNADGSQSALKLTEIYPQVRGVVVVTPQAEDARIQERIVTAVTTAFGIPSSRVCVVLSN